MNFLFVALVSLFLIIFFILVASNKKKYRRWSSKHPRTINFVDLEFGKKK